MPAAALLVSLFVISVIFLFVPRMREASKEIKDWKTVRLPASNLKDCPHTTHYYGDQHYYCPLLRNQHCRGRSAKNPRAKSRRLQTSRRLPVSLGLSPLLLLLLLLLLPTPLPLPLLLLLLLLLIIIILIIITKLIIIILIISKQRHPLT